MNGNADLKNTKSKDVRNKQFNDSGDEGDVGKRKTKNAFNNDWNDGEDHIDSKSKPHHEKTQNHQHKTGTSGGSSHNSKPPPRLRYKRRRVRNQEIEDEELLLVQFDDDSEEDEVSKDFLVYYKGKDSLVDISQNSLKNCIRDVFLTGDKCLMALQLELNFIAFLSPGFSI